MVFEKILVQYQKNPDLIKTYHKEILNHISKFKYQDDYIDDFPTLISAIKKDTVEKSLIPEYIKKREVALASPSPKR